MENNLLEKDAIVFLGLMAIASKKLDVQFTHPDGVITHTNGLNIFAAVIDNIDGEVIGQQHNSIHAFCNPMLHAEQLTLKEAIDRLNHKRPRVPKTTSVETYYREYLFNTPNSIGNFDVGATIYTTLEPCPFCTSALLVSRMKRIVYIIPDALYGKSYSYLKETYYKKYDMTYSQLSLGKPKSTLMEFADKQFQTLMAYVQANPTMNGTLYLDLMQDFLSECKNHFLSLQESDLLTIGTAKDNNLNTLTGLQSKAS